MSKDRYKSPVYEKVQKEPLIVTCSSKTLGLIFSIILLLEMIALYYVSSLVL